MHRIGKLANKGPRPIVAKLDHFKHKEIIKSKGKELKKIELRDQLPISKRNQQAAKETISNSETAKIEQ